MSTPLGSGERRSVWGSSMYEPESYQVLLPGESAVTPLKGEASPLFTRLGQSAETLIVAELEQLNTQQRRTIRRLAPAADAYLIRPSQVRHGRQGAYPLNVGDYLALGRLSEFYVEGRKPQYETFDNSVSREHASLELAASGRAILTDEFSTFGTYYGTVDPKPSLVLPPRTEQSSEYYRPLQSFSESLPSEQHPDRNEDALFTSDEHHIYAVFDGVGGHAHGTEASHIAADILSKSVTQIPDKGDFDTIASRLQSIMLFTNNYLANCEGTDNGGYTTATILKVHTTQNGEQFATVASLGDSRAYRLRNGKLTAITTDHTPYRNTYGKEYGRHHQERLAMTESVRALTPQGQLEFYDRRLISHFIGSAATLRTDIDIEHIDLQSGDRLLLSTDGIHDNLTTREIEEILKNTPAQQTAHALSQAAVLRSRQHGSHDRAKPDDITAIVVQV